MSFKGKYSNHPLNKQFNLLAECLENKYTDKAMAELIYEPISSFNKTRLGYFQAKPYQINALQNIITTIVSGHKPIPNPRPKAG